MRENRSPNLFTFYVSCFITSFKVCPLFVIVQYTMAIIEGSAYGFVAIAFQKLFESVTVYAAGKTDFVQVLYPLLVLLGIIFSFHITGAIFNICSIGARDKMTGYFTYQINKKIQKIPPVSFENTDLLDDINKASEGAQCTYSTVDTIIFAVCNYVPYYTIMYLYLGSLDSRLSAALLFVFIPMFISEVFRSKTHQKLEDTVSPLRREFTQYKKYLSEKETRVLGAFGYFKAKTADVLHLFNHANWESEKKITYIELFSSMITLVGYGIVLFLFVRSLFTGNISLAAFAAIFASIDAMFQFLSNVFNDHVALVARNTGMVKNYMNFCNIPEEAGRMQVSETRKGISCDNVSFHYPNTTQDAVHNVTLNICEGEIIAVVGENGSGKSTLIKLIAGLYTPTKGSVSTFGCDTNEVSKTSLYRNFSAVFQNFQKYKMTCKENIQISDIEIDKSDAYLEFVAGQSGLDVSSRSLPDGYQTMLSRDFGGIELSHGQWQRLAIARGIYKDHGLIFLDEPTAAIDPIEESELFHQFVEISKGKTTIIVTHRLGSAKIADRIVVLDKGEISEIGTHEELLKGNGKYSELYQAQAKWYAI